MTVYEYACRRAATYITEATRHASSEMSGLTTFLTDVSFQYTKLGAHTPLRCWGQVRVRCFSCACVKDNAGLTFELVCAKPLSN